MAPRPVELSTTLADLYSLDGGNSDDVALVYAFPTQVSPSSSLPTSVKYAYQGPRTMKLGPNTTARFTLGALSQYYGFAAGPMDLHLFDMDRTAMEKAMASMSWGAAVGEAAEPEHRRDARRTYAVLSEPQRPRLHFVERAGDVAARPQKKVTITPMDFLDGHGPLVDQEAHWRLLSKRTLALAGDELPSPPTQIIDTELRPGQAGDAAAVAAEIERMLAPVATRALPFVVKLPLSLANQGVFMLDDEEKRRACVANLREQLPTIFAALTEDNAALTPASLLLQDVVPGATACISYFVTKAGRAVYLCSTEQLMDEREYWAGSFIDYRAQDAPWDQYRDTLERAAAYVYKHGFHGPMGVDIMTTPDGQQLIVDLNVRQTGSHVLGFMKKHFWENGKLPLASLICPLPVMGEREKFEATFASEIEEGRLVITAWSKGKAAGGIFVYGITAVLVAAETIEELRELSRRVNALRVNSW